MRVLHSAAGLLEAPRPESDGSVLFSDVTNGGVYRYVDGEVEAVVPARRGIGGLALHADGGLVMTGKDVAYSGPEGVASVLTVDGATGINDLTVGRDGSVYVGVLRHQPAKGEPAGPSEVLRIDPTGVVTEAATGLRWPNGMGFSPDGETLYVCEYSAAQIRAVRGGRSDVFATAPRGECDGLAVDVEGGVWVALGSAGAIARFTPDGALDTTIDVSESFVSSLAFAGSTLYVTTWGELLTADAGVAGLAIPEARIPAVGSH